MAQLSTKHPNQQIVALNDFSGGLNTSVSPDGINDNQLVDCVNMELDSATNRLKTVAGTKSVQKLDINLFACVYDGINHKFLLIDEDKKVYLSDLSNIKMLGSLSGTLYPVSADWENGVLVASGGKLQYYNGEEFLTLENSPDVCSGVYVRSGRVLIYHDNEIRYSAVGNEEDWTENDNDDSASKFIEAGYKDGGKFIGMVSLSSDILIIKDNKRIYRLSGEYPEWQIKEVSRNVDCIGRRSYAAMANSVFVLGKSAVQAIQPTDDYGDVMPSNVGMAVVRELNKLPKDSLVKYVPPLQQFWFIGTGGSVLVFDVSREAWFKRQFNSGVIDVISVGENIFVIRQSEISLIDEKLFRDNNKTMTWKFRAKRLVSHNAYLLKRTQISVLPFDVLSYVGVISVGAVMLPIPVFTQTLKIYKNKADIHRNKTSLAVKKRALGKYAKGERVYQNPLLIYGNGSNIFSRQDMMKESRNVYRSKFLDITGYGEGCGFVLNGINLDVVEV